MLLLSPGNCRRTFVLSSLLAVFASAVLLRQNALAEQPQPPTSATRIPWTSSGVVGSPDPPPPFKVVRAFPNIKLEKPVLLARCPGSERLFIGEQGGVL